MENPVHRCLFVAFVVHFFVAPAIGSNTLLQATSTTIPCITSLHNSASSQLPFDPALGFLGECLSASHLHLSLLRFASQARNL